MHCSVTIRANLYQAIASRRDEILAVLGYAWGHLTLLAGSVVPVDRYYMRKNKTITLTQLAYIDAMFDKFMHGSDTKLWTKLWNTPIKDDEDSLLAFTKLSPGSE